MTKLIKGIVAAMLFCTLLLLVLTVRGVQRGMTANETLVCAKQEVSQIVSGTANVFTSRCSQLVNL